MTTHDAAIVNARMSEKNMNDIWKDEMVVEALKERTPDDIAVLDCPRCGMAGYYNEGSHFTCSKCDIVFYVTGNGEIYDGHFPSVCVSEARKLSDCFDDDPHSR